MKTEIRQTKFDGRSALIIGKHPHKGEIAICNGVARISIVGKWAMKFTNQYQESFFVFDRKNVKWIEE